jgi:hypothetical protein
MAVAELVAGCSNGAEPVAKSAAGAASSPPSTSPAAATPTPSPTPSGPPSDDRRFEKVTRITGALTPKSVDASSTGFVVAQNMIYTHTISVFNPDHELVTTIKDRITPSEFGYGQWTKSIQGAPVEPERRGRGGQGRR